MWANRSFSTNPLVETKNIERHEASHWNKNNGKNAKHVRYEN
jgi:hypothetical protein